MAKNPISIYRIELDVDTHTSQNMIYVKQGDTNRNIHMYITEKGKPVDLSNCYAVLKGVKPDGTILFNDATLIDDNKFVYELTPQTTANAGMFECELTVFDSVDGNKIVTSARFQIYCDKALYNNAIIESRNEYTALTNALASAQNVDVSVSRDEKKHKSDITITDRNGIKHSASVYDGTVIRVETLDLSTAEEGVYFCKNVKYRDIYYPEPFYDLEGNILLKEDNLIVFAYYTGNIDLQEGKEFKVLVIDFNGNILKFNQITKKYETINDANIVENSTKAPTSDAVFKALINKVDKVEGKQLTSNDFTDALNNKLNSIEENANHTVIDNYLSTESTHAVQNGMVTSELMKKIDNKPGAIWSSHIEDSAITEIKLSDSVKTKLNRIETKLDKANNSVKEANIDSNAVTTSKIANKAVTTDKIASQSITSDLLDNESIKENHLSASCIDTINIKADVVTEEKLSSEVRELLHSGGGVKSIGDAETGSFIYATNLDDGIYTFNITKPHVFRMSPNVTAPFVAIPIGKPQVFILSTVGSHRFAKFFGHFEGNVTDTCQTLVVDYDTINNTATKTIYRYISNSLRVQTVDSSSTSDGIPSAKAVYDAIQLALTVDTDEVIV